LRASDVARVWDKGGVVLVRFGAFGREHNYIAIDFMPKGLKHGSGQNNFGTVVVVKVNRSRANCHDFGNVVRAGNVLSRFTTCVS
jgi:hypothetical protein